MSPFQGLYGREPPVLHAYVPGSSPVAEVDRVLRDRDEILQELKSNLVLASNQMKQYANRGRREETFQIGDYVYLKLQPSRQQSVFKRAYQKLASIFFGPFKVVARLGSVAYKLELPEDSRIHPVFHVSLLKRRVGMDRQVTPTLPL